MFGCPGAVPVVVGLFRQGLSVAELFCVLFQHGSVPSVVFCHLVFA